MGHYKQMICLFVIWAPEPQFFPTTCLSRPQGSATAGPYPIITGYVPTGEFLKSVGDTCYPLTTPFQILATATSGLSAPTDTPALFQAD
jgi:hypothetical protein